MQFDHQHYVPIMKAKRGEFRAMANVAPALRTRMTPLLELPEIPYDFEKQKAKKTLSAHIGQMGEKLAAAWGTGRIMFDTMPNVDSPVSGLHPMVFIADQARQSNVSLVPVTGLNHSVTQRAAVATVAKQDQRGAVVRVPTAHFNDFNQLDNELTAITIELDLAPDSIDLVIDMGSIEGAELSMLKIAAKSMVNGLPRLHEWRTVTIAGTAVPRTLTQKSRTTATTARTEWLLWQHLVTDGIGRIPTFGDYTVSNPEFAELDWRLITLGAKLRYTLADAWMHVKGISLEKGTGDQNYALAKTVAAHTEFRGGTYSWGDDLYDKAARRIGKPGNLETWKAASTSQHLAWVPEQISNHLATSTPI